MNQDLRDKIKAATEATGASKPDIVALLQLVDQHYDRMEATITQSLQTSAPVEAIFDSVTDALLSVGENGIIRNCNKVCANHFRQDTDALIGSPIENLLPAAKGKDIGSFLKPFLTSLEDTTMYVANGELEARRHNGDAFTVEINGSKLEMASGIVYVLSLRDVTGRKQAERVLKDNEERYRALVENAPEAIIVWDVDANRFVDANDNACLLFNLSRRRLMTVGPEAISPPKQPDGQPSFLSLIHI